MIAIKKKNYKSIKTRRGTVTSGGALWHRHSLGVQPWKAPVVQVGHKFGRFAKLVFVSVATEIDISLSGSLEGRAGASLTILMQ